MDPQFAFEQAVNGANPCWGGGDVHIVEICEHPLAGKNYAWTACMAGCCPKENRSLMRHLVHHLRLGECRALCLHRPPTSTLMPVQRTCGRVAAPQVRQAPCTNHGASLCGHEIKRALTHRLHGWRAAKVRWRPSCDDASDSSIILAQGCESTLTGEPVRVPTATKGGECPALNPREVSDAFVMHDGPCMMVHKLTLSSMTEASFRRRTRPNRTEVGRTPSNLQGLVLSAQEVYVLGSGAPTTCVCCVLPTLLPPTLGGQTTTRQLEPMPMPSRPVVREGPGRAVAGETLRTLPLLQRIRRPSCELLKSERQLLFADEAPLGVWGTFWERPSTTSNLFRALRRPVATLPEGQCARFGMGRAETWERSSSQ